MKLYQVIHTYDVDGGFGDAITKEDVIYTTDDIEKANDFISRYCNPHVYDTPYDSLECGSLELRVVEPDDEEPNPDDMWWLNTTDKGFFRWRDAEEKPKEYDDDTLFEAELTSGSVIRNCKYTTENGFLVPVTTGRGAIIKYYPYHQQIVGWRYQRES